MNSAALERNTVGQCAKDAAPQVPAMATSGGAGQNVEADRVQACHAGALCDERPAGSFIPAVAALNEEGHLSAALGGSANTDHEDRARTPDGIVA